ncbi:hypothetical protein PRIPAC_74600 [Pristionchus pacificus]|uniref:Uncharacterized protein n=1 Tax=Pristionchus pacificus TaxID=54126 RepID=A0A2A6C6M9_PRIPA|nr:hypothetical protein PRIPAC_74600 [Pristionchus pacificus]|eukprot:PDM73770.1 hypothetical protein PRIPAC_41126 [Pristionchus pacificus]
MNISKSSAFCCPKGLQKVLDFQQILFAMASSRAFTLILLLVSFSLGESRWEKLDKVKEQVDVALHRKNPDTLVRACGDQLLAVLMEIDLTSRCPTDRNRRASGNERGERRARTSCLISVTHLSRRSISHHCCRSGCSYESLTEIICADD